MIYCGIDWAEHHHDVALVDDTGQLVAKLRIDDTAAGYRTLLDRLAEHGDTEQNPIPVAIETSRGLLVAVLRAGKRQVFAINPMAAARYRDRHGVSRKKSDPGDALVVANILRTDMAVHRPLPQDSDLAQAIAVLARAQQEAIWNRQQLSNQLRSLLREYYPAALEAFANWQNGLCRPEARAIMAVAPTPSRAAGLSRAQLRSALKRAGRTRGIEAETDRMREIFRADYAHQPPLVEDALGKQMLALLRQLEAACIAADDLARAVEEAFPQHPDADVILSPRSRRPARRPGACRDRRRPPPVHRRPRPEGLRRLGPHHPRLRKEAPRRTPPREERPAQPRRPSVGLRLAQGLAGRERPLPPTTRARRLARSGPAAPVHRMIGQLFHCLQRGELFDEQAAFPSLLAEAA